MVFVTDGIVLPYYVFEYSLSAVLSLVWVWFGSVSLSFDFKLDSLQNRKQDVSLCVCM